MKNKNKKTSNKSTIAKVLQYIKRYWILLLLSIILAAITVALTLYIPVLVGKAVDLIVGMGEVDLPGVISILLKIGIVAAVAAFTMVDEHIKQ